MPSLCPGGPQAAFQRPPFSHLSTSSQRPGAVKRRHGFGSRLNGEGRCERVRAEPKVVRDPTPYRATLSAAYRNSPARGGGRPKNPPRGGRPADDIMQRYRNVPGPFWAYGTACDVRPGTPRNACYVRGIAAPRHASLLTVASCRGGRVRRLRASSFSRSRLLLRPFTIASDGNTRIRNDHGAPARSIRHLLPS
jgi:hypothetical protein